MKQSYTIPQLPVLAPQPSFTHGTLQPVVSLDGVWQICQGRTPDTLPELSSAEWQPVDVPSSMTTHRKYAPGQSRAYTCTREIPLQSDWQGNRLFLRFESVNGFADICIDGTSVGSHKNPFLAFGFDITDFVQGKTAVRLTVHVQDWQDTVSTFSGGGILRSVALYVLPQIYCSALRTATRFDHQFRQASLEVTCETNTAHANTVVRAALTDPHGLPAAQTTLCGTQGTLYVDSPLCWDAEHPQMYTLSLEVETNGVVTERLTKRVGLRQIDRAGNRLYVNGKEVKLRGACRHEISPTNGRCLTPELIRRDVELFREANCNYIRTSHYPPSEYFLDLCDEVGIYVEDELPLAFIARSLNYTQRDPAETDRYLSVFADVYVRDCNHPSVLMWSLCNESFGGYNFDVMNRWAHQIDPTRPTKFSYPMTIPEEHAPVDIWSVHYGEYSMDPSEKRDNVSVAGAPGKDMPILHDEYVHVPCYNRTEHRRDPNVRNFWGEGLKLYWDKIWNTEGALGGAIWAGIDETDIFTGGETRLEWGIIDVWRRKKPEHYLTRKAYSPIVAAPLPAAAGKPLEISVENRFCHTNLEEVTVFWRYGGESGHLRAPFAPPRALAVLTLPCAAAAGKTLWLTFTDAVDVAVDEYLFTPLAADTAPAMHTAPAPTLTQDADNITVSGEAFTLCCSKSTCLIAWGEAVGERVLLGGPYLHMPYFRLGAWQPGSIAASEESGAVCITIHGMYENTVVVTFTLQVYGDGVIDTHYTVEKLLRPLPHAEKLRVGVDCGGLDELGVAFLAAPSVDRFAWTRKGMHSWYPEDHIARNEGVACRFSAGSSFSLAPEIAWSEEMCSYILNGKYDVDYKGTNDFRSLKPNILSAQVYAQNGSGALCARSDAAHSVRLAVEEPQALIIPATDSAVKTAGTWTAVEDVRGSRTGTELWSNEPGAFAEVEFTGTGIVWYASVDTVYGIAKVSVDGTVTDACLSQRVAGVDFPGSAAGYDKKYDYPVYSVSGLAHGKHTLRIEVTGEKVPDAGESYLVLDYFRVLQTRGDEAVRFIVCNDYNYPHIAWGNYCKPAIFIEDGYTNHATIQLQKRK